MSKGRKMAQVNRVRNLPPKEFCFKKGQIGNSPGRPKIRDIREMVQSKLFEQDHQGRTQLEVIVNHWIRRTKQGDTAKGKVLLAYGFGWPIQQNLNINENINRSEMSLEEVRAELDKRHEEMGIPATVVTVQGHREVNREAVKARVNELLEKRRVKALPAPQIVPGSETLQ
jgi:hypothetical protein